MQVGVETVLLEGGCYVVTPDGLDFVGRDNWEEAAVIDRDHGAEQLSCYVVRVGTGRSPIRAFPGSDVVVYVVCGEGEMLIAGRRFRIAPETGVYVRPNEAFAVDNPGRVAIELVVGVCPQCRAPRWLEQMPENFDAELPHRIAPLSQSRKQKSGDRYFQLLIGPALGSQQVTQFIGSIPLSKAPAHHHSYEEAIVVLAGRGTMWTGQNHAPVEPGSIIYLPRGQRHSLECRVEEGMQVMGLFYPAGSPAVRYEE